MNVSVETLTPCRKLLRFEVDAQGVEKAFEETTKDFLKHASVPGFRPGKAPKEMVVKKFEKEIEEEVRRKLLGESYRDALKANDLKPVGPSEVEEVQFARGQPMTFIVKTDLAPQFELPPYRGLPAQREEALVPDADIDRALEALRMQKATFETVTRPVQDGDFVVVNYTGTSEGKPLTEIASTATRLTEQKKFWVEVKPDAFLPGFSGQLLGANAGEQRTVKVDLPAEFVIRELAGKPVEYVVEVLEVKRRLLPEVNDAFAKSYEAENVAKLREGVRRDLQNELNLRQKRSIRNQVVRALLDRVNFDLPESLVNAETRNVVYDIVAEFQQKGASREQIDRQKEEIYSLANRSAAERVKLNFIFHEIAEKEGIRVHPQELDARLVMLARTYSMEVKKFVRELEKRRGVEDVAGQILHEKVIDFLVDQARLIDVPRGQAPE